MTPSSVPSLDACTDGVSSPPVSRSALPAGTTAGHHESPAVMRFRERVRMRTGTAELLAFRIGDERFALDVRALDEAVESPPIEAVPAAGESVLAGVSRHDGRAIPVFDAGRVLGVRSMGGGHVLLMRSGNRLIGLMVDDVEDVVTLDLGTIHPAPFEGVDELLLGVTWAHDTLTAILDARALIIACQQRSSEVG